ncbi:conserved protein of unknown function [Nitrospira japonica]|uniref:Uncharacterized protein n=1 Tax=Nitrospira japonica TaxID=1325564 RepID=A0A1W1I408_9BACT|nr:hypothetical protein [Nitrospira japonica]SLM47748.1 conserved protein of unknown function [Nitrospira japonica]
MLVSLPVPEKTVKTGVSSRGARGWLCLSLAILFLTSGPVLAKSKIPRTPRPEPDLKILEFKINPTPYNASAGQLEFSAVVQLPKDLDGATLLEISSLLTSPSKTSIRFISTRKPLDDHEIPTATHTEFPRLPIVLTWDGMDHQKMPASAGLYHYEMRAKLLANGEKGPRTLMVSWPKRGTIEVR